MPKETSSERLELLARILQGAIGAVVFARRAFVGHPAEPDDLGLDRLLGMDVSVIEKEKQLRDALIDHVRRGETVNRVDVKGDERGDPETRYEFRLKFRGTRIYVKTVLNLDDPDDPIVEVKKAARQN